MAQPVLATHKLQKSFGALLATDRVSVTLMPGEIHAVIGPNGAGKSTLIKQICGSLQPDSGSVDLLGKDISQLGTAARAPRLGPQFSNFRTCDGRHGSSKCCAWRDRSHACNLAVLETCFAHSGTDRACRIGFGAREPFGTKGYDLRKIKPWATPPIGNSCGLNPGTKSLHHG